MSLLLDTHVVLWWRENSPRLGQEARNAIARADLVYVSAASAWEVAIKIRLGKLRIPGSFAEAVDDSGFSRLPIDFSHAELVATLPNHHSDPFDRMLVAQARAAGLTLVTHDRRFEPYRVPVLWA
ncbi:MAG TPA: type II toxin-antitoxin system VapC family toxin [Gemmatimonadales bacterium]|nr:type II toxin-antitoxin system VapC family toxin [Gemmatimonadales bacterium]